MNHTEKPWLDGLTIGAVLRETARRYPLRDAMVFLQSGFRANYKEFDQLVDQVAKGLLGLGLTAGAHVAVWSTNRPEWVLLQFATARVGMVLVTVNPSYRAAELAYVLKQSDAKLLALIDRFRNSDYFATLAEINPRSKASVGPTEAGEPTFPHLAEVISLVETVPAGMRSWSALFAAGATVSDMELAQAEDKVDANSGVNLQYTSGTTGFPKGALLSHRNLLMNVYYAARNQNFTELDRLCIPVPLYHCFGCVLGTLLAATCGSAMVFPHEYFDAEKTLDAIEQESCTALYGVPTMFIAQLEHPSFRDRNLRSLRTGIMAGSPCPIELMKRVTGEMGVAELTIGYGQTEASPLITQTMTTDSLERRVGTVGRALPGLEVKIVDPLTAEELGIEQSGELCSRGHGVMLGYYNNPDATAKAIDSDGWLHTGDLAKRDSDGYFRITGRLKDLIIRGGENISPREIEECLYTHPAIEEVQVVGVPDLRFGEEVLAVIKARVGHSVGEEEVREFCRSRLARFKVPRYVQFVENFPMTVTGKIQKYKLREQAIVAFGLHEAATMATA